MDYGKDTHDIEYQCGTIPASDAWTADVGEDGAGGQCRPRQPRGRLPSYRWQELGNRTILIRDETRQRFGSIPDERDASASMETDSSTQWLPRHRWGGRPCYRWYEKGRKNLERDQIRTATDEGTPIVDLTWVWVRKIKKRRRKHCKMFRNVIERKDVTTAKKELLKVNRGLQSNLSNVLLGVSRGRRTAGVKELLRRPCCRKWTYRH